MTKSLLCLFAVGLAAIFTAAAPGQQLSRAGLRAGPSPSANPASFNAVAADSSGNLFFLLDQKDGVRILKTDPAAANVLAQAHIGAHGDIGIALCLDPAGSVYVTGTATSGSLPTTSGAPFPSPADASTNSFVARFDSELNPVFVTYAGSGRTAATAIAATADAVFLTGSTFSATLPVTPSGIIQVPASGSFQNGFVERFNSSGTELVYATYLSGLDGDTAPSSIAADSSDNAYIAGYTTSTGYPTLSAIVPAILSNPSGFLTELTPQGDGITFSTFIPGAGVTSLALDTAAQNLLLSGSIAPGQFPITGITAPLAPTAYQAAVRMKLDGSAVLSSTLLAPGTQSTIMPAPNAAAWAAQPLTTPLLPAASLATIGNTGATALLRINSANIIDQAVRLGGLALANPDFASLPTTLTGIAVDASGQPTVAGSVSPTASSSLLATQTWDLALTTPTAALPSTLRDAALPAASCNGSLCSGSAAFAAQLNFTSAPSLALSTDGSPNLILRNLGSAAANNLQLTATGFTLTHTCPTQLAPGAECNILLAGSGPGSITAQAASSPATTIPLPATTATANPIVFSPHELDFNIATSSDAPLTRTLTITNLGTQPQTFTSALDSGSTAPFTEQSSDCPSAGPGTKSLAAGAICHITLAFTPSSDPAHDGPIAASWTLGSGFVQLTAFSEASPLSLSSSAVNFGTQYVGGLRLPRFLYLSNNSTAALTHTRVALPSSSPFAVSDQCPTTLEPHTACQLRLDYSSPQTSSDSVTLELDQGASILVTGQTIPQPGANGTVANPNLSVAPTDITFPNPVVVTNVSSTTQTVTVSNTGTQTFTLTLALTGDFTDTTNCGATLAGGASCSVILSFAPSAPGARQGLLAVTAGTGTTPLYVNLSGTGTGILTANNGTIDFGNVVLNQPVVQWFKIVQPFTTLTATSSAPDFNVLLVEDTGYGHGSPAPSAFTTTATGTCVNCWLGIQFRPTSTGQQNASLALTSNTSGNPYTLALSGTGIPLTGLVLTPVQSDFGPIAVHSSSAPAVFTLTNLTPTTANLTAPTITGDFTLDPTPTGGPTCNGPLAANASCFLAVTFAPTTTGQRTGTLTLSSDAQTASAALSGYGSPDPGISFNPSALTFDNVPGTASTQQTITVTNTGTTPLQIAAPTSTSASFIATTTCSTLAPAATCTLTVTFLPTTYTTTGTLSVAVTSTTPGAPISTYTLPLSGSYTTEDIGLQILPAQADYGPAPDGALAGTRQFTINNLSGKPLTLALSLPRQFVLTEAPCAALAPGASCNFSVAFLPLTNGDITGTLFAQATPTDGSATLNGLGYVEGYGTGAAALTITGSGLLPGRILSFGQVPSGQSASQTLTLANSGSTSLTIRRITSEWPFLATTTCGAALAPSAACTVTLTYTPLNQAATGSSPAPFNNDSGTLVIESDAGSGPDFVDLAGTTTPAFVASPSNNAPLVAFTASQNSLTFAATSGGNASTPQTITLSNTGTAVIHIASVTAPPDFTVTGSCPAILPGAGCPLTVTFTPQAASSQSSTTVTGALQITSDASNALDFISLLGTATPSTLVFSPTTLDFGPVLVNTSATLPITLTNASPTAATFGSITATGDYTFTTDCPSAGAQLAPSATCTVQVTFKPAQAGTRNGTLSVATSLTPLPLVAQLTGTGVQSELRVTPSTINFGSVTLGSSATQTLTLSNTGTAAVTSLALAITGDYAVTSPCSTTALAPGASCAATLTFTPTASGTRTGTLTVTSASLNPITVPLSGNGSATAAFTLTVNNAASASATVQSGQPATYALALTPLNGFTGAVVLNCTPVTPGQYATCSLLPSSLNVTSAAAQNSTATINTVTEVTTTTSRNTPFHKSSLTLCLLPAALLLFIRRRTPLRGLLIALFAATALLATSGCGSGGKVVSNSNPNLRYTPPGTYQYQVTASAATGSPLSQTVTLNLTVTPQ